MAKINPIEEAGFHAVSPKLDCPHVILTDDIKHKLTNIKFEEIKCNKCLDKKENWCCLTCGFEGCSRYVQSHMSEHHTTTLHPVTVSYSDLSFWCYTCDSYIYSNELKAIQRTLSEIKFKNQDLNKLAQELSKVQIHKHEETKKVNRPKIDSFKTLTNSLSSNLYKKVAFMTGAGISVNAGIPDFRTPGSGIFQKLTKYNLPFPEAVFSIEYFLGNPKPFYEIAQEFVGKEYKPTTTHYLFSFFEQKKLLACCYTQNIDGLELKAGLNKEFLVQAHGHTNSAHCAKCKKEVKIEEIKTSMEKGEVKYCDDPQCKAPCKPDVVLYGEKVDSDLFKKSKILKDVDLLVIMGTSLMVQPFSSLMGLVPDDASVVIVSKTASKLKGMLNESVDSLLLDLDTDEFTEALIESSGWKEEFNSFKNSLVKK